MMIDALLHTAVERHQSGQLGEASELYRRVLEINPNQPDALHLLGVIAHTHGRHVEALDLIRRAIAIKPAGEFAANQGMVLLALGKIPEAIESLNSALKLNPNLFQASFTLGQAYEQSGNLRQAADAFQRAVELKPDWLEARQKLSRSFDELGQICVIDGRYPDAADCFKRAVDLFPDDAGGLINLGAALQMNHQYFEAAEAYRRAVRLAPESVDALHNLQVVKYLGEIEEAVDSLRRAMQLAPQSSKIHSNLVFNAHFHPGFGPDQIRDEARAWATRHADVLAECGPFQNEPSADRRLKVGYLSSHFTIHALSRFMVPIIERHDRRRFEVHCFSSVARPDTMTKWFIEQSDRWHDIRDVSDKMAADIIHRERIDILIDLSLHGDQNRLTVFAHKPAPVQASLLAYCGTSGLKAMDYLLCDPYLIPPGHDWEVCEKPARFSPTYWCFRPVKGIPEVAPLPALASGVVTFGCLNSFGKVNSRVLAVWTKILQLVPGSRLLIHTCEGGHRRMLADLFNREGVDPARLEFASRVSTKKYFQFYNSIDIALDPFPFAGGTTTCDALWMGVPVVTLAGHTPISRGGVSILSNLGLQEMIAHSPEEYAAIAVSLAGDLPRLAQFRSQMRDRMRASPLMDEEKYVTDLESAYRMMWQSWCKSRR